MKKMGVIMNWFIQKYYQHKYRINSKNSACAVGVICSDYTYKKKNEFDEKIDELAKEIKACEKSLYELQSYVKSKYNAKKSEMSDIQKNMFKTNIILNFYPDVLETSEIKISKNSSRKEFLKWHENNETRHKEAQEYPIEKLDLKISYYTFDYIFTTGLIASFKITMEEKMGQCTISVNSKSENSEVENKEIRKIMRDIDLFRGVSKEDIENRTPRFLGYASTLMEEI